MESDFYIKYLKVLTNKIQEFSMKATLYGVYKVENFISQDKKFPI
jgi:hypothetical protein